jgi:thymidine phosphorylase
MDEPLGRAVGNALEVAECVEILQGGGPPDLIKLIVDLAEKVSTTPREKLEECLKDGKAWKKFVALVYAQDGDATALEKIAEVHPAPVIRPIPSKKSGKIKKMDAELIGRASVLLGGGRRKAHHAIDFAVGMSGIKKIGEAVERDLVGALDFGVRGDFVLITSEFEGEHPSIVDLRNGNVVMRVDGPSARAVWVPAPGGWR